MCHVFHFWVEVAIQMVRSKYSNNILELILEKGYMHPEPGNKQTHTKMSTIDWHIGVSFSDNLGCGINYCAEEWLHMDALRSTQTLSVLVPNTPRISLPKWLLTLSIEYDYGSQWLFESGIITCMACYVERQPFFLLSPFTSPIFLPFHFNFPEECPSSSLPYHTYYSDN